MLSRVECLTDRTRDAILLVVLTLLAFVVFLQNAPFTRALSPDLSMMMYAGQEIVRGHPPYKYAMIVKTPLTPMLAAAALVVGRPLGVDDVVAMRLLFIALAVGAVLLVYMFARDAFQSRAVGWFSALVLTSFAFLGARASIGPEPKLVVLVFGIATCWAIQKGAAWWAGICAALAFLAWQIAGIFLGVALLAFWLGTAPNARWRSSARVLAGFVVTLVPFVMYLAVTGALYDAWAQTVLGNFNFLRGENATPGGGIAAHIGQNISKFGAATWRCLADERAFLLLGAVGTLGFTLKAILSLRAKRWRDASWGALALSASALGFLAFAAIDFQNCPDLLPFFPALALGCGWLITRVLETSAALLARAASPITRWIQPALFVVATFALVLYGTSDTFLTGSQSRLRAPQEKIAARVEQELRDGDTIQQYGDSIVLVLTGRTNATPVLHLGPKQHQGIFFMYENGLDGYIAYLDAHKPRVITLSRRKEEAWAQKLYAWIDANYRVAASFDQSEGGTVNVIDVYVRNN
jgi:4-amino-4-deoxy-L-arabinose transferase-like glycosyltransferase